MVRTTAAFRKKHSDLLYSEKFSRTPRAVRMGSAVMKPTGTGRILLWSGGSLWIGRSGEPTDIHSHHAVQITLSLPGAKCAFCCPTETGSPMAGSSSRHVKPHAFEARDEFVGLIFVEPESREGQALHKRCLRGGIFPIENGTLDPEIEALARSYKSAAPDPDLVALARCVIPAWRPPTLRWKRRWTGGSSAPWT